MPEYSVTYQSVGELARVALKHKQAYEAGVGGLRREFQGTTSWSRVEKLARDGWQEEAPEAMEIARQAIDATQAETDMPHFSPVWDVSGCEVDVARYLEGEPENMIEYELVPTTRYGRVIVLCASVSFSGSIKTETIRRRGHLVAALAFALTEIGYAVELWADLSAKEGNNELHQRTLVKGANDQLDPARIMFAYTHPAMLRVLSLGAMHDMPKEWQDKMGVGFGYGQPLDAREDLPEGTIYLPSVCSPHDVPDAAGELRRQLANLGVIPENA